MIKSLKLFYVDAFTKETFRGNPAAVCLLEDSKQVKEEQLQLMAREINLSETAFVWTLDEEGLQSSPSFAPSLPRGPHDIHLGLRWFTPVVEVRLCGHATLASAHTLLREVSARPFLGSFSDEDMSLLRLHFHTLSGVLSVGQTGEGELEMNFPLGRPSQVVLSDESVGALVEALGLPPSTSSDIIEVQHCPSTRKLLVVFSKAADVLQVKLSPSSLLQVPFPPEIASEVKGVIASAAHKPSDNLIPAPDFVSRYFAPWVGIDEDPVTGSAHTVLAPYWYQKRDSLEGRAEAKSLVGFQAAPGRGGYVGVEPNFDTNRVLLRGSAVTVLRGVFDVPS